MKLPLWLICLLTFSTAAHAGQIQKSSIINELINNIEVENFDFTMQKSIPNISRVFKSSGKVKFVRNNGLVWKQIEPAELTFIATKEKYCTADNSGDLGNLPHFSDISAMIDNVLDGNYAALDNLFHINYAEDKQKNWNLILVPHEKELKAVIGRFVILGNDRQINDIIIEYTSGITITLNFIKTRAFLTDEIHC